MMCENTKKVIKGAFREKIVKNSSNQQNSSVPIYVETNDDFIQLHSTAYIQLLSRDNALRIMRELNDANAKKKDENDTDDENTSPDGQIPGRKSKWAQSKTIKRSQFSDITPNIKTTNLSEDEADVSNVALGFSRGSNILDDDFLSESENELNRAEICRRKSKSSSCSDSLNSDKPTRKKKWVGDEKEQKEHMEALKNVNPEEYIVRGKNRKFHPVGSYDEEFVVEKIMCRHETGYLVLWKGYNFTHCTIEPAEHLEKSPLVIQKFLEYEAGLKAIQANIESTEWYQKLKKKPRFVRHIPPYSGRNMTDEQLGHSLENDIKFLKEIGYWNVKLVELEWAKALTSHYPPIYVEVMTAGKRALWEKIPKIDFILDYRISPAAKKLLSKSLENFHMCVFEEPKDRCADCQELCELPIVSNDSVDLTGYRKGSTHYLICCAYHSCICPNGWKDCQSWIPPYPRSNPVMIFLDPRYNGWGVRALTSIPKGTILSEYLGQILTSEEARNRDTSYQMEAEQVVIDANDIGNESRFFGHSCDPNLIMCRIYVRGFDMKASYRNVLISIRDIQAGEDLNFDYHPGGDRNRPLSGFGKCRCGAKNCRGWL